MTVARLHKMLARLIDEGYGRTPVHVNKETFRHNLEADGAVILPASGVAVRVIENIDDDGGGMKMRRDGTASTMRVCIIYGECGVDGLVPARTEEGGGE